MAGLIAVVAAAAVWRPVRLGAALLAGAIAAMAAQAIRRSSAQRGRVAGAVRDLAGAGGPGRLTISSGLTASFWIYCVFVVALMASCAWMLLTPAPAAPEPSRPQAPHPHQPPLAAEAPNARTPLT